ncbi:DUF6683 family protein [Desulfogranum japonicum]|uniref:DUF6683 family protein n=1 Tax=Desulfogranum japonicum TaxID=231447 RepID=UPI00041FE251|nr:DUF6683 family protein [Desulfogranum japonicum]
MYRILLTFCILYFCSAAAAWPDSSGHAQQQTIISSAGKTVGPNYSEEELNQISRFTPSPTISARVKNRVLSEFLETVPAASRDEIWNTFEHINILDFFLKGLADQGYQVNDLAVALTAWVTTSFGILEERETSNRQDREVWQQFRLGLAKDPELSLAKDGKKQKIAEELYWNAAFFTYQYQQQQAGAEWVDIRTLRSDITKALRKRKIDPRTMTITNKGLVRK